MNESGKPRAGRKWAAIASIIAVAALGGVMWWLMGGCETKSPTADGAKGTGGDLNLAVLQAMNDKNVLELSLQIGYFFTRERQLPKSIAEVTEKVHVPDWPAAPSVTTRGLAIAYRATGERTYELVLPGDDKQPGTADDVAVIGGFFRRSAGSWTFCRRASRRSCRRCRSSRPAAPALAPSDEETGSYRKRPPSPFFGP